MIGLAGLKTFISGHSLSVCLALALAASVLLGWLFWSRASLQAELAAAEGDVARLGDMTKLQTAALSDLKRFQEATSTALSERDTQYREFEKRSQAERTAWEGMVRNDHSVAVWAAAPVPAAVRDFLRSPARDRVRAAGDPPGNPGERHTGH